MKLFYAPGVCSIGIHVLLEEIGLPYETQLVKLRENEQHAPAYLALNPKAKVPALLLENGRLLTEYGAISHYLASGTTLMPQGRDAESRAIETLDYIVGTIHMQGFARIFRTANFTPNAADEEWVKQRGTSIVNHGFSLLAATLGEQDYICGDVSYVDAALFYVELWSGRIGLALPPPLAAHYARMRARQAVKNVIAAEGLT